MKVPITCPTLSSPSLEAILPEFSDAIDKALFVT